MATITGKYEIDDNFITVYSDDNRMYVIARRGGRWGAIKVGGTAFDGKKFTQEQFDKLKNACSETGTFELPEGEDE